MQVSAQLEFGDVNAEPTSAPQIFTVTERTAVGAGEQTLLEFDDVPLTSVMGFAFNIEFADVAGRRWFTRGFYSEAGHLYRDYEIVDGPISEAERFRVYPRVGHA
jgi:hypothetical protein